MNIGKQDLTLEIKVKTDGFLEKAQAVADARLALDKALDNLENHIITHAAVEPTKIESPKLDIYRDYFCTRKENEMFEAVEKALGFKLFYWQKIFITNGVFRQYGKTTAEILRDLLNPNDSSPIDYSKRPKTQSEAIYREELRKIQQRLEACGIPTRPIFWSQKDMRDYYGPGKENNQ